MAKHCLKNVLIGFSLILGAWLIVNTTFWTLGTKKDLGIGVVSWDQFACNATISPANQDVNPGTSNTCIAKKLQSIDIECESGSDQYVTLDTLAETEKPDSTQLKAIAQFDCTKSDGTTAPIEEDITNDSQWTSNDETTVKVNNGLVQAIRSPIAGPTPYVQAKYQDVASNQLSVYINQCPVEQDTSTSIQNNNKENITSSILGNGPFYTDTAKAAMSSCATCPAKSTAKSSSCQLISGNPNSDYIFVLKRSQCNLGIMDRISGFSICKSSTWDKSSDDLQSFSARAQKLASGIDTYPGGSKQFAVYRSDTISDSNEKDPACPQKKFISYGFLCKGENKDARSALAISDFGAGNAFYCNSVYADQTIFAHEQIGHIFAKLDDEYTLSQSRAPLDFPNYNCTADPSCSKWKLIDGNKGCFRGCSFSSSFFRSVNKGIMNSYPNDGTFGDYDNFIIRMRIMNFPSGPLPSYSEKL